MKKNKLTKGLIYSVSSILIAIIVFLVISYFGKEESVQKKELSKNDKKQEQVSYQKDTKDEMENAKEEQKLESKNTESLENKVKPKGQKDSVIGNKDNNKVSKTSGIQANDRKKLSESEKDRTIGRVFNSQKEALDFGKKEVKRLVDKDKKPRQFAISKVVSENGSLKGWTVDIFEDNLNSVKKFQKLHASYYLTDDDKTRIGYCDSGDHLSWDTISWVCKQKLPPGTDKEALRQARLSDKKDASGKNGTVEIVLGTGRYEFALSRKQKSDHGDATVPSASGAAPITQGVFKQEDVLSTGGKASGGYEHSDAYNAEEMQNDALFAILEAVAKRAKTE